MPGASKADAREEELLAFVAEAMEALLSGRPSWSGDPQVTPAQLLEDLETLEWIVVGRPTHAKRLVQEMSARYASASGPTDGDRPSLWYRMRIFLESVAHAIS
jgi:hypothetical protein